MKQDLSNTIKFSLQVDAPGSNMTCFCTLTGAVEAAVRAVLGAAGAVGPVQLHLAAGGGGAAPPPRPPPLPARPPRPLLLHLLLPKVPQGGRQGGVTAATDRRTGKFGRKGSSQVE